jgi:hypothetical protein
VNPCIFTNDGEEMRTLSFESMQRTTTTALQEKSDVFMLGFFI